MASCNGCGKTLGFKQYKFKKLLRIPGSYCKPCMIKVGQDFDDHGKVTLPKRPCDLCKTEFFFLKSTWQGKKQKRFCDVCHQVAIHNHIQNDGKGIVTPGKMPVSLVIIGGLGGLLMVLGLIFTLMSTSEGEMSIVNILFGAFTTAIGFMLIRRTIRNKKIIVGQ